MADGASSPPSGGRTTRCDGIERIVDVMGSTLASSAGPALNGSTERTSTGRVPRCSCPRVGERCVPCRTLGEMRLPRHGLSAQRRIAVVHPTQEPVAPVQLQRLDEHALERRLAFLSQPAEGLVHVRRYPDRGRGDRHIYKIVDSNVTVKGNSSAGAAV